MPAIVEGTRSGPLVPETRYLTVRLCGEAVEKDGRGPARVLDGDSSAALVERLNSLPATKSTGDCGSERGPFLELVLMGGSETMVVQFDRATCGVVHRDGVVRYGGDLLDAHVRRLLG
ncbi:hypothetical protein [Phytohabitans kaempferiae]|uniref:Uncharacterized protein n=1 Tax=Phytohabitans kaempferiae TaxID=1620943 RepID=A0ABV6MDD5_9ACTN